MVSYPMLLSGRQNPNSVQVSGSDSLTPGYHSLIINVTLGKVSSALVKKRHLKKNSLLPYRPQAPRLQAWCKDVMTGAVAAIL